MPKLSQTTQSLQPVPDRQHAAWSAHRQKIERIQQQLAEVAEAGESIHIFKGGVSHFVPLPGDTRRQGRAIDVSDLKACISIDPVRRVCIAEPGASFDEILQATLAKGLMPAVVPELKGITLGGAVAGCAIESGSFRYGSFHDTCLEYELLSAQGELITCSPEHEPLMFGMMHGSYGTLGILTRLSFRLIPARPYVHVSYHHFRSFFDFKEAMLRHCRAGDVDFIDGIIHGPQDCVLCLGQLVEHPPFVSRYDGGEIYYKSSREKLDDYLSTYDYCFRYDADCHWLSRKLPVLEKSLVRRLAGSLVLGSTNLIRWEEKLRPILQPGRPDVICDVFLPQRQLGAFWEWYAREFDFYPLWVVPSRLFEAYPWLTSEKWAQFQDEFVVDCAVYGKPENDASKDYSQLLEQRTDALGGIKTLISRNHFSREHFWQIYDRANYAAMRLRLDPAGRFPDLYDKMHRRPAASQADSDSPGTEAKAA